MLEKLDYVKYNSGTAQPKLNADVVAKLSVNVANSNEQFAISQLFKSFSQSIASNQRQQKKAPTAFPGDLISSLLYQIRLAKCFMILSLS
nr:hypothetical protein [Secundilactobacillus kimchicus]